MNILNSFTLTVLVGIAAIGLTHTSAKASSIIFDGGLVSGINGLVVNDDEANPINVEFVFGTYDEIYTPGTFFPDGADVAGAIIGELNALPSLPFVIDGGTSTNLFYVPFELVDDGILSFRGSCLADTEDPASCFGVIYVNTQIIRSAQIHSMWVVEVADEISAVPLPPSVILFGTALLGWGAVRRRKQRKVTCRFLGHFYSLF